MGRCLLGARHSAADVDDNDENADLLHLEYLYNTNDEIYLFN